MLFLFFVLGVILVGDSWVFGGFPGSVFFVLSGPVVFGYCFVAGPLVRFTPVGLSIVIVLCGFVK